MNDELLARLLDLRARGERCVLVTVAQTRGSVPREAGAKMLVAANSETFGTVGGGKLEALVIEASRAALIAGAPVLKTYPLHEGDVESFGAICGGEVTVLLEPQGPRESVVLVGAGHCGRAIARLARECGLPVTVLDDRRELLADFPAGAHVIADRTPAEFIAGREWSARDALVIVSRHFEIDREALAAALRQPAIGYVGMIGSRRKVQHVFDDLRERGCTAGQLARVFAPIGLDLGADSPAEIAVSVLAELLAVLRGKSAGHLQGARPLS
jgi:xanthine dehydrogenase accessory factor